MKIIAIKNPSGFSTWIICITKVSVLKIRYEANSFSTNL